jgi:cytochrome c oxidase cbb3-type subunit 4
MIIHSIMTVLWFAVFIGVCFWAYSKKRRKSFDEAAHLPLEEDPNFKGDDHHV